MAQILSQEEIDALLQGLEAGPSEEGGGGFRQESSAAGSQARTPVAEAQPYDFSLSATSIHVRMPGLEVIFSRFTRRLRTLFVSEMGKKVDVAFGSIDAVLYEDLVKRIPLPSSIHVVRFEPLHGQGLFVITARLAYLMIDIFFGGSGQRMIRMEGREFTAIETTFLGKFVGKMLLGLEEAWQPVAQLTGRYLRAESNPYHLLGAAPAGDMMVLAAYGVTMEHGSGDILFAFPLSAIEELREELKSPFTVPDEENEAVQTSLRSNLLGTGVSVRAVVDTVELSLRDILNLRPGDLIQLHPQEVERAELWVEGKRLFRGRVAKNRGMKVFVVSGRCAEEEG